MLVDNEEVFPFLFLAPNGDPWVTLELFDDESVPPTHSAVDRTSRLRLPKPQKSFGDDLVGVVGDRVLWHDVDPSGSAKHYHWWALTFDGRGPSQPSLIKVPTPAFRADQDSAPTHA